MYVNIKNMFIEHGACGDGAETTNGIVYGEPSFLPTTDFINFMFII